MENVAMVEKCGETTSHPSLFLVAKITLAVVNVQYIPFFYLGLKVSRIIKLDEDCIRTPYSYSYYVLVGCGFCSEVSSIKNIIYVLYLIFFFVQLSERKSLLFSVCSRLFFWDTYLNGIIFQDLLELMDRTWQFCYLFDWFW